MKSFTVDTFWKAYKELPKSIQKTSQQKFQSWKKDPFHPSLKFKCVNVNANIWSVRITIDYRAMAVKNDDEIIWFWIGTHADYEKLI